MEGTQGSNFLVDSKCAVNSIDYSDPDAKLCIFGLYGDAGGWTCIDNNQRYQPESRSDNDKQDHEDLRARGLADILDRLGDEKD